MGKTHGAMLSAILLGEKSGLDPEMKKLYQKNGLGHLLAISGLHMSLIGMSVYRLLRRMGRSVGYRPDWKKAIVTLEGDKTIEFFEGLF